MRTLIFLLTVAVSSPGAASDVGAKAIFKHQMHLEVMPTAGGLVETSRERQREPAVVPASGGEAGNRRTPSTGSGAMPEAPEPMAVRYCLQRVDGTGRVLGGAPPGDIFRSGDRVQLTVESNRDGYLAIVQHGSDGQKGLLYPPPNSDLGSAPIQARHPILLPTPRHSFTFDGTPGTERLWLVLARDVAELTALPLRDQMDKEDLAALRLLVERESGAKNLVVEALTEPGDPCTYAANLTGRVVVQEIELAHR